MIGTLVFVLIFVVIGLSVVLAAMRSGRSSGPKPETRGARRAWILGTFAVMLAIGLAIPAVILVTNGDDHASEGAGGAHLSASATKGRELFARNCSTCHTLEGSNAIGRVGPNLDTLNGGNLQTAFVLDAIKKGRAQGNGQMPANLLVGQDAKDVAEYVSTVAGR